MSKISLSGIGKSFGDTHVLRGIDLTVEAGQFVTLVGPSGCGKSTLLRILAGLEAADTGTVLIGDQDVTRTRPADRNLAMVFQSYALYPHLTVAENMMTPLKLRDLGFAGRLPFIGPILARAEHLRLKKQVHKTAATLKIEALLDRKPGQLSGGQRQRAALGRAMVRNPVAFLMDEPLSNLDAALRVHMRAELSELHRRLETTFVYVTHDQAEALTMSDQMAVMMNGEILQYGRPSHVYHAPASLEVAKFVGSPAINVLPGEVNSSSGLTVMGTLLIPDTRLARQPVSVGVRPEHLKLDPEGPFKGVIRHRENLGSDIFLHVQIEGLEKPVILRSHPRLLAGTGLDEHVAFSAAAGELHVFGADGLRLHVAKPSLVEVA
ncbi:MAG: ABC transporter ATP-binding protein [Pseudomonadota bacterium]